MAYVVRIFGRGRDGRRMILYRQEQIFGRARLALPRSTLAQWVGVSGVGLQPLAEALKASLLTRAVLYADETPVPMLKPGLGRTHRAYLWSYSSSEYDELPAVVYDFADSRSGQHAREFGLLPSGDRTGCLPGLCAPVSEPPL